MKDKIISFVNESSGHLKKKASYKVDELVIEVRIESLPNVVDSNNFREQKRRHSSIYEFHAAGRINTYLSIFLKPISNHDGNTEKSYYIANH